MKRTLTLLTLMLLLAACHHRDYTPKPVAYLRFDMPEKAYERYDTVALPCAFECAQEANVCIKKQQRGEIWADIVYPQYNAVIFLTYKTLHCPDDLRAQVDTSYELLKLHFDYSNGVDEQQYIDSKGQVYATTYLLKGANVASTYQFWATDSTEHFLRGSLYLDCTPNNDSLGPVLSYLRDDIDHLIETIEWK